MPIDRKIARAEDDDEVVLLLHDRDHEYSHSEICDLLDEAEKLGFDFEGPELRMIQTARQLEILVKRRQ